MLLTLAAVGLNLTSPELCLSKWKVVRKSLMKAGLNHLTSPEDPSHVERAAQVML